MSDYFNKLNYTLANEDNHLEVELADLLKPKHILAIAGSGNRSLFHASNNPKQLTIIDTSKHQLNFCRYKEMLVRENDLNEYWNTITKSYLYSGAYEQMLKKFSNVIKFLVGKKKLLKLFSFESLDSQVQYYENSFPKRRLFLALRIIGNPFVMNWFLYKGNFIKKSVNESHANYFITRFDEIIQSTLLKKNFFPQIVFMGKILFSDAHICENDPYLFEQTKKWLERSKPQYLCINVTELKESDLSTKVDFFSFSNVPSYFNRDLEINYLQRLKPIFNEGAVIVIRYYLKDDSILDTDGYKDITHQYSHLVNSEKSKMYNIRIFQFLS